MSILEREKNDRPTNEGMIRGIEMNKEFVDELKDINNLSFYQYNKYVSATYDQIPDTSLWELLETLSDRSATYWENEYTSMYIDIDRCVESMTIEDFNQYFKKVE